MFSSFQFFAHLGDLTEILVGAAPPPPGDSYVAEDGVTEYVAEDGVTVYVVEA